MEKLQQFGKDESVIITALSADEQVQLKTLLSKLRQQWLSEHAAYYKH